MSAEPTVTLTIYRTQDAPVLDGQPVSVPYTVTGDPEPYIVTAGQTFVLSKWACSLGCTGLGQQRSVLVFHNNILTAVDTSLFYFNNALGPFTFSYTLGNEYLPFEVTTASGSLPSTGTVGLNSTTTVNGQVLGLSFGGIFNDQTAFVPSASATPLIETPNVSSPSAGAGPTSSVPGQTSTPPGSGGEGGGGPAGLSVGAKAGIGVGVALGAILLVLFGYFIARYRLLAARYQASKRDSNIQAKAPVVSQSDAWYEHPELSVEGSGVHEVNGYLRPQEMSSIGYQPPSELDGQHPRQTDKGSNSLHRG